MPGGVSLYPAVETLHILGFACLLGAIFVFDLRLMGLGRAIAAAAGSQVFITEAVAYL